jgi:hypothetical protein
MLHLDRGALRRGLLGEPMSLPKRSDVVGEMRGGLFQSASVTRFRTIGLPSPRRCQLSQRRDLDAQRHKNQVELMSRQLAGAVESAVWCNRIMRQPAPAKACFASLQSDEPALLCTRRDEVVAAAAAALQTEGLSEEVSAFLAPDVAGEVMQTFGSDSRVSHPAAKEVVAHAQRLARQQVTHWAELRAQQVVTQDEKVQWKIDVKSKELAKAKRTELAEAAVREFIDTHPKRDAAAANRGTERRTHECAGAQLAFKSQDRLKAEAKRLLTGHDAKHWRTLATDVSAASQGGVRDYHDRYALAEALVNEDDDWLEAELSAESPHSASAPAATDADSHSTNDADGGPDRQ